MIDGEGASRSSDDGLALLSRCTPYSVEALIEARAIAAISGSPSVIPLHVAAGVIRTEPTWRDVEGIAPIASQAEDVIQSGSAAVFSSSESLSIPLSNETLSLLARAAQDADAVGAEYVAPGHLLIAYLVLTSQDSFVIARVRDVLRMQGSRAGVSSVEAEARLELTPDQFAEAATGGLRRAMFYASVEAHLSHNSSVMPQHVLLGILRYVSTDTSVRLPLSYLEARREVGVEHLVESTGTTAPPPLSQAVQEALVAARRHALDDAAARVSVRHVLRVLMSNNESRLVGLFVARGVTPEMLTNL
jgi:hypothetical protein